jgi:hypothetical protein
LRRRLFAFPLFLLFLPLRVWPLLFGGLSLWRLRTLWRRRTLRLLLRFLLLGRTLLAFASALSFLGSLRLLSALLRVTRALSFLGSCLLLGPQLSLSRPLSFLRLLRLRVSCALGLLSTLSLFLLLLFERLRFLGFLRPCLFCFCSLLFRCIGAGGLGRLLSRRRSLFLLYRA